MDQPTQGKDAERRGGPTQGFLFRVEGGRGSQGEEADRRTVVRGGRV